MFTRKFFRQFCSKASTNISWVYEPTLSKYQYFSSISFLSRSRVALVGKFSGLSIRRYIGSISTVSKYQYFSSISFLSRSRVALVGRFSGLSICR
jgi:hypothetical protein